MRKFKVGDTIRRVRNVSTMPEGTVVKVLGIQSMGGIWVRGAGYDGNYDEDNFELVQVASEQPAVLTPLEVAEYLLAGTPELEYSYGGNGQWYAIKHPHLMSIQTVQERTFRKKPTTVLINGISVPAPTSKKPAGGNIYCVNLADELVIALDARYATSKHYWSTEAEAQEVLDAIMTSFSK